jgi:DnaA family protein
MQQLSLDLLRPLEPSLDNFFPGPNHEALERLSALARGERSLRIIYLWGESGSGKSHLLRALGLARLGPDSELAEFDRSRDPQTIITVDDCEQLDERRQEALFHLFNRVLASPRLALVCAGAQPPAVLSLREDLRTRLGYGLVLRIRPLSDAERQLALEQWMREAGMRCSPELIEHLLRHRPRDLRSLITLLHALDRFGLERQRALTVPLLREFEAHAADTLNR